MPWLIIILAYFLGAIPTAQVAARKKGKDIRELGDRNVGSANAFRELGHKIDLAVFCIDAGKGVLAILIARAANLSEAWVFFAGAAAVLGHQWSAFLAFRGGRGEATMIGVLYILLPVPMIIMTVPALITLFLTKKVTIASAVAFIPLWAVAWALGAPGALAGYSIALPCLVGITDFIKNQLKARQIRRA